MPLNSIGVIYSEALSSRRRVIVPHADDSEILLAANLVDGEGIFYMPIEDYAPVIVNGEQVPGWQVDAELAYYLGTHPLSDRCAVIDGSGIVVNVIHAEPEIDSLPGMVLVQSDVVNIGDTYQNGQFIPPVNNTEPVESHWEGKPE